MVGLVDTEPHELAEDEWLEEADELTEPLEHADALAECDMEALPLLLVVPLKHAEGEGVALLHAVSETESVADWEPLTVDVSLSEEVSVVVRVRLSVALADAQPDKESVGEVDGVCVSLAVVVAEGHAVSVEDVERVTLLQPEAECVVEGERLAHDVTLDDTEVVIVPLMLAQLEGEVLWLGVVLVVAE